jgi:transcriptional regulator with XRE-family HTH domain
MSSRNKKLISALSVELIKKRRAMGLSQEKFALLADVNRTYIAKLETGENQPTLTVLDKLALGLNLTLPELIQDVFNHYRGVQPAGPTVKSIALFLDDLISKNDVISYYELYEHFGIRSNDYRTNNNPIPKLLGEIASEDRKSRRPLRTSVVVLKGKCKDKRKWVPSDEYFKILCGRQTELMPTTTEARRTLHQKEMNKLMVRHLKHNK